MKNDIILKQNESSSIDCLKAMHNIYSQAKKIACVNFTISVILVFIVAVIKIVFQDDLISKISVLYGIFATLSIILLRNKEENKKKLAAKIQQLFDNSLFKFNWNEVSCGDKPTWEEIHKHSLRRSDKDLKNWYDKSIGELDLTKATLICMRMNIKYDQTLRECYIKIINISFYFIALIFTIACLILNKGIFDIILYYIVPVAPFIIWYVNFSSVSNKNAQTIRRLDKAINKAFSKLEKGISLNKNELEQIQDQIYYKRLTNFAIPNWFYKLKRKYNESESKYAIKKIIKK